MTNPTTTLTLDEVKRIAHLARLFLTDAETALIQGHFSGILDYFQVLNAIDTKAVLPMSHSTTVGNTLGKDIPRESLSQEKVLRNTTSKRDGLFVVPAVIE